MTRHWKSQLLPIPILFLLSLLAAAAVHAAAAEQQPITRPGCADKCGDLSIPFPFGMNNGCFLPGFEVTCNKSFDPPRAFLADSNLHMTGDVYYSTASGDTGGTVFDNSSVRPVELMDISTRKSEARAYGAVRSDCTTSTSTNHSLKIQRTSLKDPFLLSPTRNVLVGVGWNVEVQMVTSLYTTTGYMVSCVSNLQYNLQYANNGSCRGQGCCEATLQDDFALKMFGVLFGRKDNFRSNTNPCSYGMVVENSWYNFSTPDMYGDKVLSNRFPRGVPFVVDFAIRNGGSCPAEGQQPPQDYACVSGNSSCASAAIGEGYICKCWDHYDGNPYITNGCQDIDECELRKQSAELSRLYPCSSDGICKNVLGGYDCPCKPGMKGDGKAGTCTDKFPLAAKVTVGLAGLIVVFVLMVMTHQLLKLKRFYEQNGGPLLKGVKNIRIYTRKQLKQISNNYKCVIGEGHFGKVYLGTLGDKQQVAIKKSIKVDKETKKEFTDEVIIQSEMRHKNIVRLLGCCLQMDVPMLVYEFVVKGSLYDVLFGRRDSITVDTRLRIAIGSAEGLAYMHSAGESTIRHGDVKSANILLDDNFTPKVSDFGTSKLLARGIAEKTERVIGDMSYIDPIYMEKGVVTQKSDVYSFGVVLIELITRRPAKYDDQRSYVANFVQASLDNRAREFIDNDITREEDIKLLDMASAVAVECLEPNPEDRPDMKQVEQRLAHIIGQSTQPGQEINYQGNLSPALADVALLKAGEERSTY